MNRFERIKADFEKSKGYVHTGITMRKEDIEWLILSHIEMKTFMKMVEERYGVAWKFMKEYLDRNTG